MAGRRDEPVGAGRREIEAAMLTMRREAFLPGDIKRHAHMDSGLPIGFGQTNSQPTTVANMMELLDVPAGARVLDVGSGSGWSTAILAELVGPEGEVHGVELVPELVERGRANLSAFDCPWATIRAAVPARGTARIRVTTARPSPHTAPTCSCRCCDPAGVVKRKAGPGVPRTLPACP